MKTIITYGTFDLFHIGHLNLLKRLSNLGDKLIVGLSTDEFNYIKGKKAIYPFKDRLEILKGIRWVSEVIPEENWDQKRSDIINYSVTTFAMGDDWKGKFDHLSDLCNIIYLPRTRDVSTTDVKDIIKNIKQEKITEISMLLEEVQKLILNV